MQSVLLHLCSAWSRKEGKLFMCIFHSRSRLLWIWLLTAYWLSILTLQGQLLLSCLPPFMFWELALALCLHGALRLLVLVYTSSSTLRLGAQKCGQTEMWIVFYLWLGSCSLLPVLSGIIFLLGIFFECFWILEGWHLFHPLRINLFYPWSHSVLQKIFATCTDWSLTSYERILKKFIGIYSICNVMLVSSMQQSDSVIHIHISTLF